MMSSHIRDRTSHGFKESSQTWGGSESAGSTALSTRSLLRSFSDTWSRNAVTCSSNPYM